MGNIMRRSKRIPSVFVVPAARILSFCELATRALPSACKWRHDASRGKFEIEMQQTKCGPIAVEFLSSQTRVFCSVSADVICFNEYMMYKTVTTGSCFKDILHKASIFLAFCGQWTDLVKPYASLSRFSSTTWSTCWTGVILVLGLFKLL